MTTDDGAATAPLAERLADFPWDQIASYRERASAHPDGLVNLSMGTPVDPTPGVVRSALVAAAEAPGYPTTQGQLALRQATADWMSRRWGVAGVTADNTLPLIGTKELLAWLPTLLEVAPTSAVAVPDLAYPSYVAAINIVKAQVAYAADPTTIDARTDVRLCYVNYPNNPTGKVATVEELRRVVEWARARDVVLVSDECYLEFAWSREPVSILHPDVCGGSYDNLLSVHSLSKRSNMAGYRSGFFAGDPRLMRRLLSIRKHLGVAMPSPIQAASIAAFNDDEHVDEQRARYRRRRDVLTEALRGAGWNVPDCEGGLYLWIDRAGHTSWESVSLLADHGILATPGDFYGPAGAQHVRVALTALDDRVDSAADRLHALA
jgi:succinyldiaminopimelate transaminase